MNDTTAKQIINETQKTPVNDYSPIKQGWMRYASDGG